MKPTPETSKRSTRKPVALLLAVLAVAAAIIVPILLRQPPAEVVSQPPDAGIAGTAGNSPAAPTYLPAPPAEVARRPLPVSVSSKSHEWTEADTSDPDVIQLIAHGPEEAIRMIEENDRIHRRQLVYRNETAAAVVQQAMARGEQVSQLTLPGLDGQELVFEIERADLAPSGQSGSFTGHLAGRPSSQVSLGFKFGREAFTVISPEDNLYLQADPREPGEIIVKSIDPATYVPGTCGTPGHDH